jgi:hypothetical protein
MASTSQREIRTKSDPALYNNAYENVAPKTTISQLIQAAAKRKPKFVKVHPKNSRDDGILEYKMEGETILPGHVSPSTSFYIFNFVF